VAANGLARNSACAISAYNCTANKIKITRTLSIIYANNASAINTFCKKAFNSHQPFTSLRSILRFRKMRAGATHGLYLEESQPQLPPNRMFCNHKSKLITYVAQPADATFHAFYNEVRMPTAVRSHAKINLGLYIGAPRPDGFHGLTTVYQTLEIYDVVTVTAHPAPSTAISLTSNDIRVPTDHRNTAWKMVVLALESLNTTAEVHIHIEKRLPIQGGLGAGSANAVAALMGLESELWPGMGGPGTGDRRTRNEVGAPSIERSLLDGWEATRLALAAQVGSDVPLFLIGGAVLGLDRGQKVIPLNDIDPTWCLLAIPSIGVSTPQAFRDWDALCATEGLTQDASQAKLNELSRAYASAFAGNVNFPQGQQGTGSSGVLAIDENLAGPQESALVRTGISSWIQNDFERVVFPQHPSLAEIKRILAAPATPEAALPAGSLMASLSGSGSALFGLYQAQGDAEAAKLRIMSSFQESEVRTILTRTLPRQAYWRDMLLQ
jgi:4-diphosphocytidyl-2-C-methyl-D-erythritol kinase